MKVEDIQKVTELAKEEIEQLSYKNAREFKNSNLALFI